MRKRMFGFIKGVFVQAAAFALASAFVVACSDGDKTAGGTTEDAGIIADLNVAGLTQKGPFAKGSAVTVQGIDCKTMALTGEVFEGKVKSDKGDFEVKDVNLSSTCAVFEVTGYYFNELTGKKSSDKLTLHTLTDLKDRKNVNINLLTQLEYERVMNLAAGKETSFADAKKLAEKEVLAAFGVKSKDGEFAQFEDLNIFKSGDDNAALLAVSVMVQGDESVSSLEKRMEKFAGDFAEDGQWNDSKTKKEIAEWAASATENGKLDTIRKNVESMNNDKKVPAFEKFIEAYADGDSREGSSSSSAKETGSEYDASANTLKDLRDGKTYKTVKIGNQVWMAENLNFETEKSYCYNDSSKYCDKYGRLYTWAAAVDACPTGWHLPASAEFDTLFKAVGAQSVAGNRLKAATGWKTNLNLGDEYGFSALPAGNRYFDGRYNSEGTNADFWASTEDKDGSSAYAMYLNSDDGGAFLTAQSKNLGKSARCVKDDTTSSVSSSSAASSSSVRMNVGAGSEYDVATGTLKDLRDGKTYKAVKIGKQTWMAENLNYETENSRCYNDSSKYCDKYGRLYTWAAAIDSIALANDKSNPQVCGMERTCELPKKVQGSCPSGWHLPTRAEWLTLFVSVGGMSKAGQKLMSKSDWENGMGTDDYGFSALPAGDGSPSYIGFSTYFWSTTQDSNYTRGDTIFDVSSSAYAMRLLKTAEDAAVKYNNKNGTISIRCVMDDTEPLDVPYGWSWDVSKEVRRNPDIAYDSITDTRDSKVYKTVKIGSQTWMADNLDYSDSVETPSLVGNSACFNNDVAKCEVAGRLYTWAVASEVCPSGWHLPDSTEWQTLITTVGEEHAAEVLKSQTGWKLHTDSHGSGTDAVGFFALPVGHTNENGVFGDEELYATFWTASDHGGNSGVFVYMWYMYDTVEFKNVDKKWRVPVRCVKD
ncbi:MAG: fibrobacter succinogenes major paralogous domain-containing protein [Fibrobacter sp.]|nr:fibrobacter succinogenes major paralogous domain-containing protein [Fibrobacter sp.]